jgi:hypothetical protein
MRIAAIALAALLLAAPAWAQSTPPGATDESRRLALELGGVIGIDAQVADVFASIHLDLVRGTMQQSGKGVDLATPIVDTLLMPGFTARRDELAAVLVEPWASNFNPGELRLLHSFFASPLGQRYLRLQPTLVRQATQGSDDWKQQVLRVIVQTHATELRARGLQF